MSNVLNEAFASPIVASLWKQPFGKTVLMAHFVKSSVFGNSGARFDINQITDDMIQVLSPKDAFKIRAKNAWKFWMMGDKIVGVTRSNSLFDQYWEVRRSRRGAIICITQGFYDMYSMDKKTWAGVTQCVIMDADEIIKQATRAGVQKDRKNSKDGALALMSNRDIKQGNLKRYEKLLKDAKFSDGSEFALINNVAKVLTSSMKKTGATRFLIDDVINGTWLCNYLSGYSALLVDYLELLNKYNFILPSNVDAGKLGSRGFGDDSQEKIATKLRNTLKDSAEDVTKQLSYNRNDSKATDMIVKNSKEFQAFLQHIMGARYYDEKQIDKIVDFIKYVEVELPIALANKNISTDIMNFEVLVTQLVAIQQQLRNSDYIRPITSFLDGFEYYLEAIKAKKLDSIEVDQYLSYNIKSANTSILKRVIAYINLIKKI